MFVRTVELQLDRIRLRVAKGGHAVPEERVRARRLRSFDQLSWFLEAADAAWIFDNSASEPELVGRKISGQVELSASCLPSRWNGWFPPAAELFNPHSVIPERDCSR